MTRAIAIKLVLLSTYLVILAGCGGGEPRYGEAVLSEVAPQASLSGTTFGEAPALELAPGCPGFVDPETPAHRIRLTDDMHLLLRAESSEGPLALAVAHGDEVACDSDQGSGHGPHLALEGEGEYLVYIASLREPSNLAYTLEVRAMEEAPASEAEALAAAPSEVTITLTSTPPQAQVFDAEGSQIGVTPLMFVTSVDSQDRDSELHYRLELEGYESLTLGARPMGESLVLHGEMRVLPTLVAQAEPENPRGSVHSQTRHQPRQPRRTPRHGRRLPEYPDRSQIVTTLARLRSSVERCAAAGGRVDADFDIIGSTGRVQRVRTSGPASSAERSCVGRVIRGARFPQFRRSRFGMTYSFALPVRTPVPAPAPTPTPNNRVLNPFGN